MRIAQKLTEALQGVAPGAVVSIGVVSDKATWRIDHRVDATDAQKSAANTILAEFDPTAPTADDVRAEASRRMVALTGARDAAHLDVLISNASREAIRLLRVKSERAWTDAEAARAAALEGSDAAIEAIRAASNALEVMQPVPVDYRDDARWPA